MTRRRIDAGKAVDPDGLRVRTLNHEQMLRGAPLEGASIPAHLEGAATAG